VLIPVKKRFSSHGFKNQFQKMNILRTTSEHEDFVRLVRLLDADLAKRDGADHSFYAQFNKIAAIKHVVVLYENNQPVGCGAIKEQSADTMEVKRMYVLPESRKGGMATRILTELEHWAGELGYTKCVLETGKRQPEAIALYKKNGYKIIPNYGQYAGIENSVCFEKELKR
jgi:putative acetyltransferase